MPKKTKLSDFEPVVDELDIVSHFISKDGFFKDYITYASSLTDAPAILHLWTSIGVLSALLGKDVSYRTWGAKIRYPNIELLIITPSGFYRKGTVLGIGRDAILKVNEGIIFPNEFSTEKLLSRLNKQQSGVMIVDEFGHLYGQFERSYMVGCKELFCELWDNITIKRELMKTTCNAKNPALTIIGASTAQFIENKVNQDDWEAGFWGRFLIVHAKIKQPSVRGMIIPDDILWNKIITHLTAVDILEGEADFSLIQNNIDNWIDIHESITSKETELSTFYSRSGEYLKKLSIIAQAGIDPIPVTSKRFTISKDALDMAVILSEWHRSEIAKILHEDVAFSWIDNKRRAVNRIFNEKGGKNDIVDWSDLLRCTGLTAMKFKELMDTLIVRGDYEVCEVKTTTKPKKVIKRLRGNT